MMKRKVYELEKKTIDVPKYPVQTLEKALDIIEVLSRESGNGLGISELSRSLDDMGKSTIHRILDTLTAYGYVEKSPIKANYRLSWRFFEIGNVVQRQRNLSNIDSQILQDLRNKYQETVNLAVRVKEHVVIISKLEPITNPLRAHLNMGEREPLHATALGKVLISEMYPAQVRELLGVGTLEKLTSNTIIDVENLIEELQKIRDQGYAIDDQELCLGVSCIAMPVKNYDKEIVAAISVTGPTARMNYSKITEIKEGLSIVTRNLSEYLGAYNG